MALERRLFSKRKIREHLESCEQKKEKKEKKKKNQRGKGSSLRGRSTPTGGEEQRKRGQKKESERPPRGAALNPGRFLGQGEGKCFLEKKEENEEMKRTWDCR